MWRRGSAPALTETEDPLAAAAEAVVETAEVARTGFQEASTRENAVFVLLTSFVTTFILARAITTLLRGGRGWARSETCTLGRRHIHHYVPGILLAFGAGGAAIVTRNEGIEPWLALPFGAGMGLVMDESALLLDLDDVYWSEEGIVSVQITLARHRPARRGRARLAVPAPRRAGGARDEPRRGRAAVERQRLRCRPWNPAAGPRDPSEGPAVARPRPQPPRQPPMAPTGPQAPRARAGPQSPAAPGYGGPVPPGRLAAADAPGPGAARSPARPARQLGQPRWARTLIDGLILLVPVPDRLLRDRGRRGRASRAPTTTTPPRGGIAGDPSQRRAGRRDRAALRAAADAREGANNGQTWGKQMLGHPRGARQRPAVRPSVPRRCARWW